ncbi:ATP-binding cassette domain-containing protein [Nostocoides sp. F2B08]|uniref:energy-coupling factor ABC transporter ATP-binding protein n=1 Tax=Nostocoides sp. F2B08 TaxID=2653936 RepID=UPI001262E5A3|nr:ABC transporter ATP-binding protein [Tetrasphaera sp. F2B08]KAB7746124.1 ATP-binding cassette domain-containing protein [Tetrasphaera sp. F2B08]
MTPAVIELDELSVAVGGRRILDRVSVRVTERRLGVIGPNGSGKSTLARVLGGLTAPTSGAVTVVGIDPARDGREARSRIGFCFADPDAQIVMPTVREDVDFSLRRSGLDRETRAARVSTALHRFGLSHLADAPAHRLSSGEKQLLALAASLVREPELLICDEPTTLLDLSNSRAMAAVLWGLTEDGDPDAPWAGQVAPALVVVSHDLDLVGECDRVLRLEDGVLVDDGAPDEVIEGYRDDMARR